MISPEPPQTLTKTDLEILVQQHLSSQPNSAEELQFEAILTSRIAELEQENQQIKTDNIALCHKQQTLNEKVFSLETELAQNKLFK
jgi:hypothetical protein